MDYATIQDLESRWRVLTADERARASTALADASVQLRRDVPGLKSAVLEDTSGDLTLTACQVVCAMVRRAMDLGTGFGVTSTQEAQGPFSRSLNYANPMGDLYSTKAERRRLGGGQQQAFAIDTGPALPTPWWETLP